MDDEHTYPKRECEQAFKSVLDESLEPIKSTQTDMYQRMFVDNGAKSIQSSLSNISGHIKFQWFIISILLIGLIGLAWRIIAKGVG